MVTETNRANGIQNAIRLAKDRQKDVTVKFLGVIGEANEVLVKVRKFFDAGRILLYYKQGIARIPEAEVIAKTQLLHRDNYLNNQLHRLAAIHKTLDSLMREVSQAELILVQSVITALEKSEEELVPLMKKFDEVVDELQEETTTVPTPTSTQQNKSFDDLLDVFKSVEINRKAIIKEAMEAASIQKNNNTVKFLGIAGEADEILVNVRRFFDAGRIMFNTYKRRLTSMEQDVKEKTKLLREENYMNNQVRRLAAMYSLLEEQIRLLPDEELNKLRPVIDILKRSEQKMGQLVTQFQIDLDKMEKVPIKQYIIKPT
nr:PREDICTED: uncharacterized protein LOC109033347 isoform X2 [Bemisia tabaci]